MNLLKSIYICFAIITSLRALNDICDTMSYIYIFLNIVNYTVIPFINTVIKDMYRIPTDRFVEGFLLLVLTMSHYFSLTDMYSYPSDSLVPISCLTWGLLSGYNFLLG